MKNIFVFLLLSLLFTCCATTKKTSNTAIINTLVGQNELVVLKSLGAPTKVIHTADGGKVMAYEHFNESATLPPNKSNMRHSTAQNKYNTSSGFTYTSNSVKGANDPNNSIYEKNVDTLKIHIDKQGNCFRITNTLPPEQLEIYNKRLKPTTVK